MRTFQSVLITGGCGFIGSNLIRFVRSHRPDWRITNLDALRYSGNRANVEELDQDPGYRFVHGDIGDRQLVGQLLREHDAVLHLAAESHVDRSIADARPFVETNVLGTQCLLDAAREAWRDRPETRFVHVSTDEVYGSLPLDEPQRRFHESSPLDPSSPYSASKAASDLLVGAYHRTFGLDVVLTRCSNNFGPYQFPEKVIPLFVTRLLRGQKVPLYGDGLNVRDWLHVEDHCEALLLALERGRSGQAYNIGADNEHSNQELARTILELMDKDTSWIEPVPDRQGHDRRYAIDAGKIRSELGWSPRRSRWPDSLAETVRWYRDHTTWWERILDGSYRK
ncbi:MAG: dTDP-glucose 4,6-dehydratase [Pirellulaceae bacterium]